MPANVEFDKTASVIMKKWHCFISLIFPVSSINIAEIIVGSWKTQLPAQKTVVAAHWSCSSHCFLYSENPASGSYPETTFVVGRGVGFGFLTFMQ